MSTDNSIPTKPTSSKTYNLANPMVVDGVWSVIGSANFDNRSFELNDELTVAVQDPGLAQALTRDFEEDIRKSIKLDAAAWRQRPLWQKMREWFWSHYGELF